MIKIRRQSSQDQAAPDPGDSAGSPDYWDQLKSTPAQTTPPPSQGTLRPGKTLKLTPKKNIQGSNILRFDEQADDQEYPSAQPNPQFVQTEQIHIPQRPAPPQNAQPQQQQAQNPPGPERQFRPQPSVNPVYQPAPSTQDPVPSRPEPIPDHVTPPAISPVVPKPKRPSILSRFKSPKAKLIPGIALLAFFGIAAGIFFVLSSQPTPAYVDTSLPKEDQQRQIDLHKIAAALDKYYDQHDQQYPFLQQVYINGSDDALTLELVPLFIKTMPVDPSSVKSYYYSSLTGKSYLLRAKLSNGQNYSLPLDETTQ